MRERGKDKEENQHNVIPPQDPSWLCGKYFPLESKDLEG